MDFGGLASCSGCREAGLANRLARIKMGQMFRTSEEETNGTV